MAISIVGAGPAGSTAAIFLAKNGFENIKLYERSPNRRKPCGGGLSWRVFEKYGDLLKGLEINTFKSVVLDVNKKVFEVFCKKPLVKVVDRFELDKHLRSLAENYGVKLIKKSVEPRELRDDIVVDARGVEFKNNIYITRVALCKLKCRELTLIYRPSLIGLGYFWIFPLNDDVADVGCGGFTSTFKAPLNFMFEKFIKDIGAKPMKMMGYPINVGAKIKNLVEEVDGKTIVQTGERAGLVNSLTGEGIYYAVSSSELLAKCMKKDDINSYENEIKRRFGWELSFSKRLLKIGPLIPEFLIPRLLKHLIKRYWPNVSIERGRSIAWSSTPA